MPTSITTNKATFCLFSFSAYTFFLLPSIVLFFFAFLIFTFFQYSLTFSLCFTSKYIIAVLLVLYTREYMYTELIFYKNRATLCRFFFHSLEQHTTSVLTATSVVIDTDE